MASVVAALAAAIVYAPRLVQQGQATPDAYLNAVTATRTTLVQAILGLAVFIGAGVGYLNLRHSKRSHRETLVANREALDDTLWANSDALEQTLAVTQRGQVTDRFTKAIEQLGSDNLDVRLGGVYALEQIARDATDLHWPIIEILTAFVREHSRQIDASYTDRSLWGEETGYKPTAEILAIIRVLKRRDPGLDQDCIDLAFTDLHGVDLSDADLKGARLSGVSFVGADLSGADLSEARLWYVNFGSAKLNETKFVKADLKHVQMNEFTSLHRTDFTDAEIVDLYLDGASLNEAITDRADISGVQHARPSPPGPAAPPLYRPPDLPIASGEERDETSEGR